ncbi:substrate binding domain-containing protein [Xanthomonas arboricola]|uniref:substrate binding domain-containing protein n=1 Tax=Xanthomonas arboricola TaxID=56448 RepID=UPI0006961E99|nr:substrate binding domain-containing protein [Xanthomonas arboricola]
MDEARLAHEQLGKMLAQPTGVLRASFPVDFAVNYLAPLIAEFSRRFPGIAFEFNLTPRRVDLVSEPFDVAIRMGETEDSHLITRPLARLPTALYALPRYLEISGTPRAPDELSRHECIGMSKIDAWTLHDGQRETRISVGGRLMPNSSEVMRP